MLRFDVFGTPMGVTRRRGEWRAYYLGADGKHRKASDVVIPPELAEEELPDHLADLFHESASPEHPDVVPLGG